MSSAISHNVPAVNDVFLRPIRKNAQRFYGRKKMWRSNTPQRAIARLVYCVARAAEGGEAFTDLLCAVGAYSINYSILFYSFFIQKKPPPNPLPSNNSPLPHNESQASYTSFLPPKKALGHIILSSLAPPRI